MRQAIIENGIVVNIAVGNAGGVIIPENSQVAIGWGFDGANFIPPATVITPSIKKFSQELKSGLGGIKTLNVLARKYPLLKAALDEGYWQDAQELIIDALTSNTITQAQYDAIKVIAANHNIPINL